MIKLLNYSLLILLFILVTVNNAIAQQVKQVEIIHSNTIEFDKSSGINAKKLIGDVQFQHQDVIMYCDSAYFYSDSNYIDAFGHIHIKQGDTLHLYGELLHYNGNERMAQVRKKVRLVDTETVLKTENLDFNIKDNVGYYFDGGVIVNKENKLTSKTGYYYTKEKTFYYRKNVVIENPKYTIKSDTLKYNTINRTAYFFGPTYITSDENLIYCENGWYNTNTNISQFNKNAYLKSNKQLLKGDSLYYERNKGIGKAFRNIELIDTTRKVTLKGNIAHYTENPEYAMITDRAEFIQYSDNDTLYMHADTLKSVLVDTISKNRIIRAYYKVKIFRKDLQGKCDSLSYTSVDSTMRLFGAPVLWSGENQMTADYIELLMANRQIKELKMISSSFISSKVDSAKFNQIRGKNMTGFFNNNELVKMNVEGNGQTIYYIPEGKNIIGVNKAESSDLMIYVSDRKIKKLVFLTKPEGTMYPLDKVPPEEIKLKGFKWYGLSRPKVKEDIFKWYNE
jgi:lipopolysaccharide export system protein LptA